MWLIGAQDHYKCARVARPPHTLHSSETSRRRPDNTKCTFVRIFDVVHDEPEHAQDDQRRGVRRDMEVGRQLVDITSGRGL